jgi:hypothetical protein
MVEIVKSGMSGMSGKNGDVLSELQPTSNPATGAQSKGAVEFADDGKGIIGGLQSVRHLLCHPEIGHVICRRPSREAASDRRPEKVKVPGLGEVRLDERAVRDSLGHGMNRAKAAGFAAVPDVLARGQRLSADPWQGGQGDAYPYAGPIKIGCTDHIAVVLVHRDANSSRMYVHEVVVRKKLHDLAFKTGAPVAAGERTGAKRGVLVLCSGETFSVKSADVSKVVDSEGSPLVVSQKKSFASVSLQCGVMSRTCVIEGFPIAPRRSRAIFERSATG